MFHLFRQKHDISCKQIKPCKLTETILAHLAVFLDRYRQETGISIPVSVCEEAQVIPTANSFDLPFCFVNTKQNAALHTWIQAYQSAAEFTALPAEFDVQSLEFLNGYETDDSYQALFEEICNTYQQVKQPVRLAFAVSPWSEAFDCEDCLRIFW